MENKKITVEIPFDYEIDEENSTWDCIKLKKSQLSYNDISKELFNSGGMYILTSDGKVEPRENDFAWKSSHPLNSTNVTQLIKLRCINMLMNVSVYLNGDWTPNFEDATTKYFLYVDNCEVKVGTCIHENLTMVYFKTEELAFKAIEILSDPTLEAIFETLPTYHKK